MSSVKDIRTSVRQMYMSHPFPQWTKEERRARLPSEVLRYRNLGLEPLMKDARFIEMGCGTANTSILAAKYFDVKEFVGLDMSRASLDVAQRVVEEENFDRFVPVEGDLFNVPYPDGYFDVVVSWGVLHHTPDPFRGLQEMVRLCRPGGGIGIFLYNKWHHWRHNQQKRRVDRLAGDDVEERFRVAHRLYGTKPLDDMSPGEVVGFYDKYCHPHKSDHTYGETLHWFDQLGLEYLGSYTPLRFGDFVRCFRDRAHMLEEFPSSSQRHEQIIRWIARLPVSSKPAGPPFRRPSVFHRFFWQALLAWHGRHGAYSQGSAFAARKPANS